MRVTTFRQGTRAQNYETRSRREGGYVIQFLSDYHTGIHFICFSHDEVKDIVEILEAPESWKVHVFVCVCVSGNRIYQ